MHRNHTKIITMYKILVIKKKLSLLSKPRLSFHHDSQLSPTTIASIMAIEHHPLTYMLGTWGLGGGPSVLFAPGMLIAVGCWWRQYHKVDIHPTGRQCPLSGVGEDFLACRPFLYENGRNSEMKSCTIDMKEPKWNQRRGLQTGSRVL